MKKENEEKIIPSYSTGFTLADGTIVEQVFDRKTEKSGYSIRLASGEIVEQNFFDKTGEGDIFMPVTSPLVGKAILFPSKAEEYGTTETLYGQIRQFIHKYLEIDQEFEAIASFYAMMTWVHDSLRSLPYLRFIGGFSSGKTRGERTVGTICYRPLMASGATTVSPIFRILDKMVVTLVLDEADWQASSAWTEIIKILNIGYERGTPVLRSEKQADGNWDGKLFQVFGPKIIATRGRFQDEALESRCLTQVMHPNVRDDIPLDLPPEFDEEALHLRNKLLMFRFNNLFKVRDRDRNKTIPGNIVSPRFRQVLSALASVIAEDERLVKVIADYANNKQKEAALERRETVEAKVLETIVRLNQDKKALSMLDIAQNLGVSSQVYITAKKAGEIVRNDLHLRVKQDNDTHRSVIDWDDRIIQSDCEHYGIDPCLPSGK